MTGYDFEKAKNLLIKATYLLNSKKKTDLALAHIKPNYYNGTSTIVGLETNVMSSAFDRPGHLIEELFSLEYFDPQARVAQLDDYTDYGKLSGDDKVVARLAFWLYCVYVGKGWFASGRSELMKKKPLEWRDEHGIG